MDSYRVTARRDGNWWSHVAHDVGGREVASQSRQRDGAEHAIREAIALVLDVDPASFGVEIDVVLRDGAVPARERPSGFEGFLGLTEGLGAASKGSRTRWRREELHDRSAKGDLEHG